MVRADRKAVEIDSAILIDAFKMQDDGFPDRRFFQNKSLLIPIFSAGASMPLRSERCGSLRPSILRPICLPTSDSPVPTA